MEIQNLRLQLLHIADGDIVKAKAMEAYVLAKAEIAPDAKASEPTPYKSANLGEESNAAESRNASEPKREECSCFLCALRAAIEKDFKNNQANFSN
jgi:hypothetical protein